MTVEEMRALMRRRVVPENLVVQNIVEYLMDDSAQLPQLNAYSFLNRLQQLGMGSADFVVLLEGCKAPQPLVDKIKANPAMNLNSLVLTLESYGLTHEDYSRMLYTARLVWEQTQTSGGTVVPYSPEKEKTPAELFDDDYDSPEAFSEPLEEKTDIITDIAEPDKPEELPESFVPQKSEEADKETEEPINSEKAEESEETEKTTEEAVEDEDALKSSFESSGSFEDTSTLIVSIDPERLKRDIEQTDDKMPASADESALISNAEKIEENGDKDFDEFDDFDDDFDDRLFDDEEPDYPKPEPDYPDDSDNRGDIEESEEFYGELDESDEELNEFDESDEDKEYKDYRRLKASGYNKPALTVSALFAVVLFAISAYFSFVLKLGKAEESVICAKNSEEIFLEVLNSYNAKNIGGENAQTYFGGERLFGNILIRSLSENAFGMLSDGSLVYTGEADKITVHESLDVNSQSKSFILPPNNTRFVGMWESKASIIAVFSGAECGFMRVEKGETIYTVRQDGALCDFAVEEDEISFGSVYVPRYTKNFMASDVEEYLPRLGKNGKSVIPAENIALGGSSGCSFAVWGKYSLESGENLAAYAAIGDPVYSGAYGVCAMNYTNKDGETYGRIIKLLPEEPESSDEEAKKQPRKLKFVKTIAISAAANGKNAFAVLVGERADIFNAELSEESELEGLSVLPSGMRFDGDMLLLNGKDGIFTVVDLSDISLPHVLETERVSGVVSGDTAAVFNTEDTPRVRLLKLDETGSVRQLSEYLITLSEVERQTLELGGANTTAILGESCVFSYKYFDGVSVVSVCTGFGERSHTSLLFDDRTGYNAVFRHNARIIAVSSKGAEIVFE